MRVSVIRGCIETAEARAIVRGAAEGVEVPSIRELCYPYHWFSLRSASGIGVSCLIDARTGRGSTSDRFDFEQRDVDPRNVLADTMSEEDALCCARRTAAEALVNHRRAGFAPRFDVVASSFVYKPFWVLGCEGRSGAFSVLVDRLNGAFHPLALGELPSRSRKRA